MAELAIKGHKERGKEVIALLEMLGGKNGSTASCEGIMEDHCYYIGDNQKIAFVESKYCSMLFGREAFTLEEFEALYPYKLRDKVLYKGNVHWIRGMLWTGDEIRYKINYSDGFSLTHLKVTDLKPYIEEDKETSPDKAKAPSLIWQQYSEGRFVCKLPEDLELEKIEDGVILLKPKKKVLPRTYEGCCEVLGIHELPYMVYTWNRNEDVEVILLEPQVTLLQKLETLRRIITCRDAYWKLSDDWSFKIGGNSQEVVYAITICGTGILKDFYHALNCNRILVFPTEEMRDTFYENFENLINECKELL